MDRHIKQQIIEASEAVKRKLKLLKDSKTDNDMALQSVFKPITTSLDRIANKNNKNMDFENFDISKEIPKSREWSQLDLKQDTTLVEPSDTSNPQDSDDDNNDTLFKSVSDPSETSSWSLSSENFDDIPFGVRSVNGKPFIGLTPIKINSHSFVIAEKEYKKTPGLNELLLSKNPNLSLIDKEDITNYKAILLTTNVHRREYDPSKPIKSNKGLKYMTIIKPMFQIPTLEESKKTLRGGGLPFMKLIKPNTDYVYWDNPNELVERLKLLIASKQAGNTGLDNEIISIIEELRENGDLN